MKRVVIDVNSVMPYYNRGWLSGIGRTTKELVEALNDIDSLPFELQLYSQNTLGIKASQLNTRFRYKHLCFPHKNWSNRLLSHLYTKELLTHYDLLHIPHNFEWVSKPDRTIVTLHDALFFAHPDEVYDYATLQKRCTRLAQRCRAIITCSQASKDDIMRYMGIPDEKIHVIPWGYDHNLFYPRQKQDEKEPFFLSVSCSTGRKNTPTLIRAYEQFIKQKPRHRLALVWPHPPQEMIDYCSQPHLNEYIQIHSNVDDFQLAKLYSDATATFFPSRYEGFGLPLLESMACGTPVVTCHNSALPEVGGDAALYVNPDDADAICNYMTEFEQGNLIKNNFSKRCIEQASKFSWERCAIQTIGAYQKCL